MIKNNVIRFLESKNIRFTVFELPKEKLGATQTAELLSVSADVVFKSIVILREKKGKPIVAMVPGSKEVDLKKLASLVGEKKLHVPSEREVEKLTGLLSGGISPLALIHKGFEMVLDQSSQFLEDLHISGGERGVNLRIPVKDLIFILQPKIADISQTVG